MKHQNKLTNKQKHFLLRLLKHQNVLIEFSEFYSITVYLINKNISTIIDLHTYSDVDRIWLNDLRKVYINSIIENNVEYVT